MPQSRRAQHASETTVSVRATGHVRDALGTLRLTFEGTALREFVGAFVVVHGVADLVIAETDDEAVTRGWAPIEGDRVALVYPFMFCV